MLRNDLSKHPSPDVAPEDNIAAKVPDSNGTEAQNIRQPNVSPHSSLKWHIQNDAAFEAAAKRAIEFLNAAATAEAESFCISRRSSVAVFDAGEQLTAVREYIKKSKTRNWLRWQKDNNLPPVSVNEAVRLFTLATTRWGKHARAKVAGMTRTAVKTFLGIYKPKVKASKPNAPSKPEQQPEPRQPLPKPQPETRERNANPQKNVNGKTKRTTAPKGRSNSNPAPDPELQKWEQAKTLAAEIESVVAALRKLSPAIAALSPEGDLRRLFVDVLTQIVATANSIIEELN